MKRIVVFLWIGLLTTCAAHAQTDTAGYKKLATEIKRQFAPDKRSVYFNTFLRSDTLFAESSSKDALDAFIQSSAGYGKLTVVPRILPSASLNGYTYGLANLSVTNNRDTPGNGAEMMTQMLLGTPVEVLKKERSYYLVRTPDGYLSYTDQQAVHLMDYDALKKWQHAEKVVFTDDTGHAYSGPSTSSQRVSDLVAGNILEVLSTKRRFYKVAFPDGRIAYISKKQASLYKKWVNRPNPDANKILTAAKTMLGVPYLWGGTSVKGVDCSGFVKTSFFLNGIVIPRDASQQALAGSKVDIMEGNVLDTGKSMMNLQPGDLLFFSAAKRRGIIGGKITHTAIYMGKGMFIQAAGMVRISSLLPGHPDYDPLQVSTLVAARRFLTDIGESEIQRVDHHFWYTGTGDAAKCCLSE